jgi:hypothetical protein
MMRSNKLIQIGTIASALVLAAFTPAAPAIAASSGSGHNGGYYHGGAAHHHEDEEYHEGGGDFDAFDEGYPSGAWRNDHRHIRNY